MLCALPTGARPSYIEVVVEAISESSDQGSSTAVSDLSVGEEVAYNHYSGCTIASIDAASSPLTCSVHVPGVGTRERVPMSQLRSLDRWGQLRCCHSTAPHAHSDGRSSVGVEGELIEPFLALRTTDDRLSEMEERMTIEISMLKERLAAADAGQEEDEDEMRSVFERRIMQLQEEMMSRRRRGPERAAVMRQNAPRTASQTKVGIMTESNAQQSLAEAKLLPDTAWLLHGTRVTKGSSVVTRSYPAFLDSLNVGDRVGAMVDQTGQLSFYNNGNDLGVAATGLPTDEALCMVIELRGHIRIVKLLVDMSTPKTQQELEKDLLIGVVKADTVSVDIIKEKLGSAQGVEDVVTLDRHKRLPLHHLCENEHASVEMLRLLLAPAPETVKFRDAAESTPLLCLLKRSDTSSGSKRAEVTCQRGHALSADPRRLNYCDVCRTTGTKYRCGMGCDYDMCEKCFNGKAAKFKKKPAAKAGANVQMVQHLVEVDAEVAVLRDRAGKLPLQVAEELGLSREVCIVLLEATRASGVVWCGAPNDGPSKFGVHLMVHMLGTTNDSEAKQMRFETTLQGMSSNDQVCHTTRINNLPFNSADVRDAACGPKHVVFLLKSGKLCRLDVQIVAPRSSARPRSRTQQQLEAAKKEDEHHQQKLKEAEDSLAKMESRRYHVQDDEIQMLSAITAKSEEDCKEILARYPPGGSRMSLASNEVFGMELAGGEVDDFAQGDKRGELKYAIKGVKKKIQQVEARIAQLMQMVEAEKDTPSVLSLISTGGALQEWADPPCAFQTVAVAHSEAVALGVDGRVYRWPWGSAGGGSLHPRAAEFLPDAEADPVAEVCCSSLRTSVRTQSGKVASWLDPICHGNTVDKARSTIPMLEHAAKDFASIDSKIQRIAVSNFGTCAITEQGGLYWWGHRPWPMRTNRQKRLAHSDKSADFEGIYEKYVSLSARKGNTSLPKAELLPLLSNEGLCEALVQEESRDNADVIKLLRQMRKMLVDTTANLEENATVLRRNDAQVSMYAEGDDAIAIIDGVPRRVKLAQSVKNLETREVEVVVDGDLLQVKCELQSLMLLTTEQKPKTATLLRVDRQRAVAVTCDSDSAGPDEINIVDILQIIPKTKQHDHCDAVLSQPCQVLDIDTLQQALNYYLTRTKAIGEKCLVFNQPFETVKAKLSFTEPEPEIHTPKDRDFSLVQYYAAGREEPVLVDAYASFAKERPTLRVDSSSLEESVRTAKILIVNMWTTILWIEHGSTVFKCVANLRTGSWTVEPVRCCDEDSLERQSFVRVVADVEDSPIIEIDEQGFYCSPSSHQLPPVQFASFGKHDEKCWGLGVAYGVVGFIEKPRAVGRAADHDGHRGPGGRNALHACIQDAKRDINSLLSNVELQKQLPRLLRQRDSNGATPFFASMEKGDLATAEAIRLKVKTLKKFDGSIEEVLVTPDIFGTPPLHALVRVCGRALEQPSSRRYSRQIVHQSCFEVCGAGTEMANGLYHPVVRSSYKGPTLYYKTDGNMFMFRWKREQWIIGSGAEFQDSRPRSAKLYSVPSGTPPSDLPPEILWTINSGVCGMEPAPRIRRHKSLLGFILENTQIAMARNTIGESALETSIKIMAAHSVKDSSHGRSKDQVQAIREPLQQLQDISHALCDHPGVVLGCFSEADATAISERQLDDFVCKLISCGTTTSGAFARKIAEIVSSANDSRSDTQSASPLRTAGPAFVRSCVRIFVSIFYDANFQPPTAKASALRQVFRCIFKEAPRLAIIELAKQADAALRLVRLGMALPELPHIDTFTFPLRAEGNQSGKLFGGPGRPVQATEQKVTVKLRESGRTVTDAKVARAQIFHACMIEITALGNLAPSTPLSRPLSRTYSTAHPWRARLEDTDLALLEASRILQSSWDFLFQCAEIAEETLEQHMPKNPDLHGSPNSSPRAGSSPDAELHKQPAIAVPAEGARTVFGCFVETARGGISEQLDPQEYRHLACIMDAFISFKLCLPEPQGNGDVLVPTVSVFQAPAPRNLRDWENTRRRETMLKRIGIDIDETSTTDREIVEPGELHEYPLLKALFRWRRTLHLLTSIPSFPMSEDSLLNLFEPYEKKLARFKEVMTERRRQIPEGLQPLRLRVRRGDPSDPAKSTLAGDAFEGLAKAAADNTGPQVLCRNLDKKHPWYRDAPGEGEGVIRMVISDIAAAVLQGAGAAQGLMGPSPLVTVGADKLWWQVNPMARIIPTTMSDDDDLATMSIAELKSKLESRTVDFTGCVEKQELVELCTKSNGIEMAKRRACFRALGNVAGLCLLHHNVSLKLPLFFCRHVYKFLLERKVTFADFAFFDPEECECALGHLVHSSLWMLMFTA